MGREDLDAAEGVSGIFLVRHRVELNEEVADSTGFNVNLASKAIRRLRLRRAGRCYREQENR